jgi:hypothetical protein
MRRILCISALLATIVAPQARAGGLDLAPIVAIKGVDRAFDRAQGLIDSIRSTLFALEQQANNDAKARLEQLDEIVKSALREVSELERKTVEDVDAILAKYTHKLQVLIDDTTAKLAALIEQAECAGKTVIEVSLREVLQETIPLASGSGIVIVAPPMYQGETVCRFFNAGCRPPTKEFPVNPIQYHQTYDAIRKYLIDERLNTQGQDDTPVSSIVNSYATVANLARLTACFEKGSSKAFVEDYVEYVNKVQIWIRLFGSRIRRPQ